jgi:hypothetical protein
MMPVWGFWLSGTLVRRAGDDNKKEKASSWRFDFLSLEFARPPGFSDFTL